MINVQLNDTMQMCWTLLVFCILSTGSRCCAEDRHYDIKNFFGLFNRATTTTPKPTTPVPENSYCPCGEGSDEARIVGGDEVELHQFPWMARLSYFERFYCGGTLINDRYVLTAAHCVKGFMWFLIKVTFGEHNRCRKENGTLTRYVLEVVVGNFNTNNFMNDIALLRLNDKIPISDIIRPICLPRKPEEMYEDRTAVVAGWGATKEDGATSCILQKTEIPILSNQGCKQNTSYADNFILENVICAGYSRGGKDSCRGDSGGPLVFRRSDNRFEIIGIVSWGNGCARPRYPGVYTRVTNYLGWIKKNAKDGCFCEK